MTITSKRWISGGLWLIDHVNLCKLGGQTPKPNLISIVDVFTIFHHPYPQQFAYPHLPAVWKVTNPKIISGSSLWLPFQRGSWKVGRLEPLGTMATSLLVSHLCRCLLFTEDTGVDYNIISNLRFDAHHWAHPQKRPGAVFSFFDRRWRPDPLIKWKIHGICFTSSNSSPCKILETCGNWIWNWRNMTDGTSWDHRHPGSVWDSSCRPIPKDRVPKARMVPALLHKAGEKWTVETN